MHIPPIKKRATAITNGCADCNAIFVAVAADDHNKAKNTPAAMYFQFMLCFTNDPLIRRDHFTNISYSAMSLSVKARAVLRNNVKNGEE